MYIRRCSRTATVPPSSRGYNAGANTLGSSSYSNSATASSVSKFGNGSSSFAGSSVEYHPSPKYRFPPPPRSTLLGRASPDHVGVVTPRVAPLCCPKLPLQNARKWAKSSFVFGRVTKRSSSNSFCKSFFFVRRGAACCDDVPLAGFSVKFTLVMYYQFIHGVRQANVYRLHRR